MRVSIPKWVAEELGDDLSAEFDYHVESAHDHGLVVRVLFGVHSYGRPNAPALIVEDVVTSSRHADGTVTYEPHEVRLIAHTEAEADKVSECLEHLGWGSEAIRHVERAHARAVMLLAVCPQCRDMKWWNAQPEDDVSPRTPESCLSIVYRSEK